MALAYGLMAMAVVRVRDALVRDHPITHVFLAITVTWVVQVWGRTYVALYSGAGGPGLTGRVMMESFLTAAYTAAIAPYVIWLFIQMRGALGMQTGFRHLRPRRRRGF